VDEAFLPQEQELTNFDDAQEGTDDRLMHPPLSTVPPYAARFGAGVRPLDLSSQAQTMFGRQPHLEHDRPYQTDESVNEAGGEARGPSIPPPSNYDAINTEAARAAVNAQLLHGGFGGMLPPVGNYVASSMTRYNSREEMGQSGPLSIRTPGSGLIFGVPIHAPLSIDDNRQFMGRVAPSGANSLSLDTRPSQIDGGASGASGCDQQQVSCVEPRPIEDMINGPGSGCDDHEESLFQLLSPMSGPSKKDPPPSR